jgi:hypothetical protein
VDLAERAKREAEEKTSRAREADINHRKAINQSILVALRRCGGKGD